MKRFELVSDPHFDFYDDVDGIIEGWNPQTSTLVIAGDMCEMRNLERSWLDALKASWRNLIYVPGNHDYYGRSLDPNVLDGLRMHCEVLTRNTVQVDGIVYAGATLWFPHPHPMPIREEKYMSDFHMIDSYGCIPFREDVDAENEKDRQYFWGARADVWVMHHMPFAQSIHPKYAGNHLNRFFYGQLEEPFEDATQRPKVICHGHTHEQMDYEYNGCRVVCNPRGYPVEQHGPYEPKLIEFV